MSTRKLLGALLIASPFIAITIAATVIDGTAGLLSVLLGVGILVAVGATFFAGAVLYNPDVADLFRKDRRHD